MRLTRSIPELLTELIHGNMPRWTDIMANSIKKYSRVIGGGVVGADTEYSAVGTTKTALELEVLKQEMEDNPVWPAFAAYLDRVLPGRKLDDYQQMKDYWNSFLECRDEHIADELVPLLLAQKRFPDFSNPYGGRE